MLKDFVARLSDIGIGAELGTALPTRHGMQAADVLLKRGDSSRRYTLICGASVKLADTAGLGDPNVATLVFSTFVAHKTAESFRRAEVQYLDTVGNAWVEFGDVLVDVRGRRRPLGAEQSASTTGGNLFSTGRAQVIFALLAWPQLWNAPQRDVAHTAGVSLGQANNTLTLLADAGYGPDGDRTGRMQLLDLWAAAFPTGLAKKLTLATYRGDVDAVKMVNPGDVVFLSGEGAAVDMLRPATLILYVEELDPRLLVVNRWRSDGPGNIVVRRKFWHAPDDTDSPLAGVRPAPPPLIYADLGASADPRVRAVAKVWRDRLD